MVNKTFSHHLHASKDASTSSLGEVMITECTRTTGIGEYHPFLRKNAHSGPIPWTDSLRRTRRRRGNPQHFVRQHEVMVKQFWQGIPADLRARKPNAKTAKNNSEHRINLMLKCSSAHLHTTSYLTRFLAKTCNRFKRATIREYATVRTATPADFGVKCSVLLMHPCISDDGLVLAPNRETMRATYALRSKASQHTNTHQIHKLTNKSYLDTGPNSHVLALETPSPNLPAMVDIKVKAALAPCLQGMPDGPHEDPPSTGTQEVPPQRATTRSTAVAFLGNWRRSHALKILITSVLSNKAHNQRHNALTKWKQHTKTKIKTADLIAGTVHTFLAEALRKWQCLRTINDERRNTKNVAGTLNARLTTQKKTSHFNNWRQHAQGSSDAKRPHVQLFLRGVAGETLTITVPVPVTRNQLHKVILVVTCASKYFFASKNSFFSDGNNPSCICQFPNLINYHQQTLQYQQLVDTTDGLINSWLIRKSPYQQLVVDKELIVDKVVLINKDPYNPL
jgi:hypothetical protein